MGTWVNFSNLYFKLIKKNKKAWKLKAQFTESTTKDK
jgi:hypothetical protein